MLFAAVSYASLLAGGAVAQQESVLLQSSISSFGEGQLTLDDTFTQGILEDSAGSMEGAFGLLSEDAPEWCKNETQLSWKQRKERMQQRATLEWAKKMVKQLLDANSTIPEWMQKLVADDEKRGTMRWAVLEAKRFKAEGKEIPQWMADLVAEDTKWANRWAACKCAELKATGVDAPAWMFENGRRGIIDSATEKEQEIQEEIQELDEQRDQEIALVDSQGNVTNANLRMLARNRLYNTRSLDQQLRIVELALEAYDSATADMAHKPWKNSTQQVKHALRRAKSESELLNKFLERKAQVLLSKLESTA